MNHFSVHIISNFISDQKELIEAQIRREVTIYLKYLVVATSVNSIIVTFQTKHKVFLIFDERSML